jgi:hypothetical protein
MLDKFSDLKIQLKTINFLVGIKMHRISLLLLVLILAACGGSGNGGVSNSTTLKGTVATGAPLGSGTVTVLDSDGKSVTATTDSNGLYSVNVESLKPPMIIQFSGYSATGVPIKLYSLIEKKNNGSSITANITPITDAMLTLISGESGSNFYISPDFSKINSNSIETTNILLKNNLNTLMTATNTSSNFDFIKSEFSANKIGFDMLLELVQANTMPSKSSGGSNSIMISGKLASGSIEITPPIGGISNGGAANINGSIQYNSQLTNGIDFEKIDTLISKANLIFSSKSSVVSKLEDLTDNNFRHDGETKNTFWAGIASNGSTDVTLSKGSIIGCNFSTPVVCDVSFLAKENNSTASPFKFNIPLIYQNSNWFFYGNQNKFNTYLHTTYYNMINFTSSSVQKTPYTAFEVFFSTEGAYGNQADNANLYVLSTSGWQLIGNISKSNNSFGTVGVDSFVYNEFQPTDNEIDNFYDISIAVGTLQFKLDILDSSNNVINTSNFYNVSLPMKQSQLVNMDFIGLSSDGLNSLKNYSGQITLTMGLDSFGGSFDSIGLNKNWNETNNLNLSQSASDLGEYSKSVKIDFANSASLSSDKYRAFDMFGKDAQGRRLHIKYLGCNAITCTSN